MPLLSPTRHLAVRSSPQGLSSSAQLAENEGVHFWLQLQALPVLRGGLCSFLRVFVRVSLVSTVHRYRLDRTRWTRSPVAFASAASLTHLLPPGTVATSALPTSAHFPRRVSSASTRSVATLGSCVLICRVGQVALDAHVQLCRSSNLRWSASVSTISAATEPLISVVSLDRHCR